MEALEGVPGNFSVKLKNYPRAIDPDKCTGCGQCSQACPVTAINEFNCGLDLRAATYIQYAQAVPLAYAIDREVCIGCGLCQKICLAGAVRYDEQPRKTQLAVGALVLAAGMEVFDAATLEAYSYSKSPNIVTSIEFERILSASGPYAGHLTRPYDREEPQKIAWLQCVGSRSQNGGHPYCSSVCCMYAIKEAVIAKEHARGDLDAAIFFMDMRTCGKDFEEYYHRAEHEHAVRFIRSRIHSVNPLGEGDLEINYVDEKGRCRTENFNLVVLSVGFQVGMETIRLAHRLGVELDQYNFVRTDSFQPVSTNRPGVYVCGTLQSPKDIPQSVMEASAAAAAASTLLSDKRWSQTRTQTMPPETNVFGEPPRIGVFVCQCGINIGGIVNIPEVVAYARSLPHVVYTEDNLYTCSQDTQVKMSQVIREQGINRVVVAACTPKTHEPLFQETLQNAGLNKYLFEMANIRNQDSWVHSRHPDLATEKAKDLIRMAVAKAALLEALPEIELDLNPVSLVVGGGVAGMTAAKNLAEQGYVVHLVERSHILGGQANGLFKTWQGEDIQGFLRTLIQSVENNPLIHLHRSTELTRVEGFVGNFQSVLTPSHGEAIHLDHGIAIVATGGKEFKPSSYLYGQDPRVLTQLELDRKFIEKDLDPAKIATAVFVQCVGSREPERPYCSRVCCTHTLENALELKQRNPQMSIFVLYRDLRTYGKREDLYLRARKAGIVFIRYDLEHKPTVVPGEKGLEIIAPDPILEKPIRIETDLLILATAIVPEPEGALANFFKIPVNDQGFFIEAHAKLRPVDFATEGVFLCGLAHYPKSLDESIAQALAAASRASGLLASGKVAISGTVAQVNPRWCSRCGVCETICPFNAPSLAEDGPAEINAVLCKGCGLCIASCRSGAIHLKGFDESQIMAMIGQV